MNLKPGLHPRNKHKNGYNFDVLTKHNKNLASFVTNNNHGTLTIDFSDPKAVKELNSTLLEVHYGVKKWIFPDENLCPPIPGRVDYMHYISDLLSDSNCTENITILDIGTGATCIYPLLGVKEYDWNFIATDIELDSLDTAQDIISDNNLEAKILLRQQFTEANILKGIIEKGDSFSAVVCNPPFYKSEQEAKGANARKSRNHTHKRQG